MSSSLRHSLPGTYGGNWRGLSAPLSSLPARRSSPDDTQGGRALALPPALAHNSIRHTSQDFERPDMPVIAVRVFAHSRAPFDLRNQVSEDRFHEVGKSIHDGTG